MALAGSVPVEAEIQSDISDVSDLPPPAPQKTVTQITCH